MTELLLISFATAFIISAIEGTLISLGKWRGLVALLLSAGGAYLIVPDWKVAIVTSLASSFIGMCSAVLIETTIEKANIKTVNRMPRRVPPMF
jgi:hypothetical protein